jgi:DNA repair exonuclease SbcCD nuclease subunit
MITKIIATADLHIRNLKRLDETKEQFEKFIEEAKKLVEENGAENTRIVICGDLVHSKLTIASECYLMLSWFLNELDGICKTIVVAGNHDLNMSNLDRVDSLTPVFEMCNFKQVHFIDRELEYKSGYMVDDNVVWCLYSTFDLFTGPEDMKSLNRKVKKMKESGDKRTFVGLFHGDCNGAINAGGFCLKGLEPDHFKGTDFVIAGHIHKFQELVKENTRVVYCGSLIQQDLGESITGHGYVVWTIPENAYELVEVPNENYGYYKFKIENENDVDEDKEQLINE